MGFIGRSSLRVVTISALVTGCGQEFANLTTESFQTAAFYEWFRAGDTTTDQAAGAPGAHSTLVGYDKSIGDRDFAAHFAARAIRHGARMYYAFGECFSGGMIDELVPLGGTQSILAAARHSETASYGEPAPQGVDIDFTDAFIRGVGDGSVRAETVARETVALNPFGPNPDAPRISEPMGSEHAQYIAVGGGEDLKVGNYADRGVALLWAGLPAERDGVQMNLMIENLRGMGFDPDRIWLLYGGGRVRAEHPVARSHMVNATRPIHLTAATRDRLEEAFASIFDAERGPSPDFIFFYVGDHGGLDDKSVAKTHFTPDPLLVAPTGGEEDRVFGEGL